MNFSILSSRLARTRRDLANNSDKNQKFEKDMRKKNSSQNRHFKGWNLCRKFFTNWAAIKNSTHRQETLKEKLDIYAKLSGLPIFKLGNDPYVAV